MKKKLSYWQKRYLKTKQLQLSKAVAYEKEYAKRLKETQKLIEQEIDSWCKKYAKKDGTIDPIDAKKLLKGSELKDFKYSLAEWERMAKQGGFNHEMDLEYYRSRVSRLQALQLQVTGLMGKQTSGDVKSLEGLLKGSYNDTYYRNIYNSQAVKGKFSSNFAHVDDKKLNAVIHSGWKGSNFSTRLWGNATRNLPKTLSETLFRGISLGYGPDRLTQMARLKLKDFSENQVHRLVTTEAAHIVEQATLDSYKETGLEKYEYLATLESHTCEVCGKLDGQVMEVSKQETGTNYPPIHPYCRCTTVPWDKWFEENDIKRWSRNAETGKGESIDDMSYNEWLKKYTFSTKTHQDLQQSSQKWFDSLSEIEKKAIKTYTSDTGWYLSKSGKILDFLEYFSTTEEVENINFYDLNNLLRKEEISRISGLNNIVNYLDEALDKSTITENLKVFRNSSKSWLDSVNDNKAYVSSSLYNTGLEQFGSYSIEILVPKGSVGAYIGSFSDMQAESELLLSRNTKFKVIFRDDETRKAIIQVVKE